MWHVAATDFVIRVVKKSCSRMQQNVSLYYCFIVLYLNLYFIQSFTVFLLVPITILPLYIQCVNDYTVKFSKLS